MSCCITLLGVFVMSFFSSGRNDTYTQCNELKINPIDYFSIKDTIDLVRATTYNCEVSQTDSSPYTTADGSIIDPVKLKNKEIRWVALSWDLIWDEFRQGIYDDTTAWRGEFAFNDTIEIYSKTFPNLNGYWVVHDVMNKGYRNSIDFLTDSENNKPKLGIGEDVKIIFCVGDKRNRNK